MTEKFLSSQDADTEAIQHLKQAVMSGRNWYVALLEAISLWGSAEETHNGRHYSYLIGGEAFDWLSLAERLCLEVDGLIPEEETIDLLFSAAPPIELSQKEFRDLIGDVKYRGYLNYLYGVVVEEALLGALHEEVSKEQGCFGLADHGQIEGEAYRRIYGADMQALLDKFRDTRDYRHVGRITLNEHKEFVYWLFKHRVHRSEKARVASDTKKALDWLQHQWSAASPRTGSAQPLRKRLAPR
jgi:hypothetical protein